MKLKSQHSRNVRGAAASRTLLALMGVSLGAPLFAANGTWNAVATDGNWTTAANWAGSTIPGSTAPSGNNVGNTDIVTFNAASNFSTIAIDNTRFVNSIVFDTGAGAYTFTGGLLYLRNAGSITMNAGATNAQVFSNTWQVRQNSSANGTYSFVNNSSTSSATLTFDAASNTLTNANGRPTTLTLAGSNTGNNTISSNLTNATGAQAVNVITKSGAGTWILSGNNTFTGTGATTVANGIQINGGVLSARNNNALGSNATANTQQVSINSTGTLELANGVTLDNGVSLNLNTGGTILSTGSNTTNARVNVTTTASTAATLSTASASDVFTIGNAANDLTGGAATTVLNVSGPGTVALAQSSNYAGSWSINSGTLRLGNASALGSSGAVAFGAGSTGKLQLNGNNVSLASLGTNATVGTPVVENGAAGNSTLTVNTTGSSAYAGVIQDGSTGTLALTKSGTGTLDLTGANTYTGGTVVNGGVLKANNSSGSATGSAAVSVASGGTLGGSGTISGTVSVASGGIVAPGNSVGTLTVGALSAASGSIFNFEFNSTPANDQIVVTTADGLALNGGGFNLFSEGTANAWTTAGTYNLIGYSGSVQGSGIGALSVLNPQAGYGYTFGTSGGYVTLEVALTALISHWNVDSGGSWNTAGNWNNAVPNGAGEGAILDKALTAPATVTLDGSKTVGGLTLDSSNGYTIAAGSGGTLSLDSGVSQASLIVSNGSHSITAPVALASNTVASVASGAALSLSGGISGSGSLTKSGAGSLDLDSANGYSGGTSVSGGTLNFVTGGLGSGDISINGAVLAYKGANTDDLSARVVTIGAAGATIDIGANNVSYANGIGNGGSGSFTKSGSGTLTIAGNNTYTGATTINQGGLVLSGSSASTGGTSLTGANTSLAIGSDAALGAVPGVATTNLTFNPGSGNTAALRANAALTIHANRTVSLSSGTGVIDTNGNNVTLGGALTGSGNFAKSGSGTLTLGSAAIAATGTTTINDGTLTAANTSYLPTGAITLNNNAGLTLTQNVAQNVGNLTVNGTNTITSGNTGTIFGIGAIVGGSGALTINGGSFVNDLTGSWSGFTGSITLGGTGGYRFNGATGSSAVAFDLGARGVSVRSGATGITLGSLSGGTGSTLTGSGGGVTQAVTYTVGALGTNTTFAGAITDGANTTSLTKVGTGTLTLSGASTYTGATTINAGTLALGANNAFSAGSDISLASGTSTLDLSTFSSSAKSLSVSNGVTVKFNLSSGGIDNSTALLALTNAFTETLDGGSYNIDFSGFTFDTVGSYKLFSFTSASGTLVASDFLALNSTFNGVNGAFVLNGTDLSYTLTSAIPEPSAFAAIAGVLGLGFAACRRRRAA